MRKTILPAPPSHPGSLHLEQWLDLTRLARVEVTSEDPSFPVEHALTLDTITGWRAGSPGPQILRLHFDAPQDLHHIHLHFIDRAAERSQEVAIYAATATLPLHELRRQQWTFSPGGSTEKIEDFTLHLPAVTTLELRIDPDRSHNPAQSDLYATLTALKLA